MTVYALEFLNVSCAFRARDTTEQRYIAVADTTLRVRAGEFVSVVGPTGCGKSTFCCRLVEK
jgi:NitT/TauT family transport system ATP-binding protein